MIVVEHLSRRFGAVVAVDGVSVHVRPGEVFGLLGPDGAGKTTLFRMLSAVLEPSAGTARVAGMDVRASSEQVKSRIGYMPQAFSLYGDLTVLENLRFVAEVYGVPRAELDGRLERLLPFSRLERFTGRLTEHLSGGMKQKLALASTLLHEPDVLLLDEPTTGVDPVSRREFWRILSDLNAQGKTILVATPYMDEAERCSRVALMHRGRILTVDTPLGLRGGFPGTILEVVASPRRAALAAVRAMPGVAQATVFGHALHVVVSDEVVGHRVVDELRSSGVQIDSARAIPPSLEDVFVSLMRGAA